MREKNMEMLCRNKVDYYPDDRKFRTLGGVNSRDAFQ
jgi:hypothetical protein